jgi:hypothetical protein
MIAPFRIAAFSKLLTRSTQEDTDGFEKVLLCFVAPDYIVKMDTGISAGH